MDRTQRPLETQSSESASASEIDFAVDPKAKVGARFISTTTGIVDRRLGTHNLPLGAPGRNPASPVPMEKDKRALEIGPGYALEIVLARPDPAA